MKIACGEPCEGPDYCDECEDAIEASRLDALASYYPGAGMTREEIEDSCREAGRISPFTHLPVPPR